MRAGVRGTIFVSTSGTSAPRDPRAPSASSSGQVFLRDEVTRRFPDRIDGLGSAGAVADIRGHDRSRAHQSAAASCTLIPGPPARPYRGDRQSTGRRSISNQCCGKVLASVSLPEVSDQLIEDSQRYVVSPLLLMLPTSPPGQTATLKVSGDDGVASIRDTSYSYLNACIGLTLDALLAGMYAARKVTASTIGVTRTSASTSL